jgi:dTDP-4-dehydrorhamnose 3,5-epimerase
MIFQPTKINGLYIIETRFTSDERGYFGRVFCKDENEKNKINFNIVQANRSLSREKGTLRGMHFQTEPMAETKMVQCIRGSVYDVAIDLRPDSPTYKQWVGQELSEKNQKIFLIPQGFAHGFQTLEENSELLYFMSEFYSAEHAAGVRYNDPAFAISWPLPVSVVSKRDQAWPLLE